MQSSEGCSRSQRDSADTSQQFCKSTTTRSRRRKAIPPGALCSYMQAQRACSSLGILISPTSRRIRPAVRSAARLGPSAARQPDPGHKPGITCEPHAVRRTIAELFNQRKRHLMQRQAAIQRRGVKASPRKGTVGLLSLPEDLMLKIVCNLEHAEIRPLFGVCRELRQTIITAVQLHFSFLTPLRTAEELAAMHVLRPPKKQLGSPPSATPAGVPRSSSKLPRSAATGACAASRALMFQDVEVEGESSWSSADTLRLTSIVPPNNST